MGGRYPSTGLRSVFQNVLQSLARLTLATQCSGVLAILLTIFSGSCQSPTRIYTCFLGR